VVAVAGAELGTLRLELVDQYPERLQGKGVEGDHGLSVLGLAIDDDGSRVDRQGAL
jgi:hypothetical protein